MLRNDVAVLVCIKLHTFLDTFSCVCFSRVFASNFFTAANGVILKQKLDSKELGPFGLMFYNCIVSLPVILVVLYMENAFDEVTRIVSGRVWLILRCVSEVILKEYT